MLITSVLSTVTFEVSINMLASDTWVHIVRTVACLVCHHILWPYVLCLFVGIRYDWPLITHNICQWLGLAKITVDVAAKVLGWADICWPQGFGPKTMWLGPFMTSMAHWFSLGLFRNISVHYGWIKSWRLHLDTCWYIRIHFCTRVFYIMLRKGQDWTSGR